MQKSIQLQRVLPPEPLTKHSAPGPRWVLCHQTLSIDLHLALTMYPPSLVLDQPVTLT